jgi:hypothetical protein
MHGGIKKEKGKRKKLTAYDKPQRHKGYKERTKNGRRFL